MAGYILLEGYGEFGGALAEAEGRAIELAGGPDISVSIIPTAAFPDHNYQRISNAGVRWFHGLGVTQVQALPLIDKVSAEDPALANIISHSRLVHLTDGTVENLMNILENSACWRAILAAYLAGAVIVGSGAGAMGLCQYYYDSRAKIVMSGLGLLSNVCLLTKRNTLVGKATAQPTVELPADVEVIDIDERTGLLDDGDAGKKCGWHVYGQGAVTIYRHGEPTVYKPHSSFTEILLECGL
ncbi:hypothetical protein EPA93_44560 [Ktedonosporobacter rubrisoli]|uniref:Type 1 glutamine amidotransferase-like domain-containing protein n=1 Tax=Ktedonosporobacter rubrisoli TaxID=2509675 RepID=A0A4P6K349_KTERU|nr:Type 1 glutamine amidotransferase-like domain-containing protein [Ktedonosporobacter rubrisoli]QBD82668.1 hypothetical protein EPA93_44560 [Ktedonosporobacter rubrisoli]